MAPPRKAALKKKTSQFPTWDELVAEAHVDRPPFVLRDVPIFDEKTGKPTGEREDVEIPVISGQAYVMLTRARLAGDVGSVFMHLFEEDELRGRMFDLIGKADFPVVDNLALSVVNHYMGEPAAEMDEGESSAS